MLPRTIVTLQPYDLLAIVIQGRYDVAFLHTTVPFKIFTAAATRIWKASITSALIGSRVAIKKNKTAIKIYYYVHIEKTTLLKPTHHGLSLIWGRGVFAHVNNLQLWHLLVFYDFRASSSLSGARARARLQKNGRLCEIPARTSPVACPARPGLAVMPHTCKRVTSVHRDFLLPSRAHASKFFGMCLPSQHNGVHNM